MAVAAVVLGAAVAALLVVLVLQVLRLRRLRREADERVTTAVDELSARMDTMVAELQSALDRAGAETRRQQLVADFATSLDLDDVLARVLETAVAATDADAAMLAVDDANGQPLAATLGLSAEEAARQSVAGPPDGRDVRSIEISYTYTDEQLEEAGDAIHGGVAVPLRSRDGRIGMLTAFSRAVRPFSERAVDDLETLARRAGPAIENARRFRDARQLADLDALTALHNRRYFHETLAREVARAHRYDRRLALIVFDVDDFKSVNGRIGHLAGDAVLAEVAERVRSVVRSADIACRIGGDEFGVIMPESSVVDAEQLSERIHDVVSARPIVKIGRLDVSAGVAELRQGDESSTLFERADEALYRAKESGKGRVVSANA